MLKNTRGDSPYRLKAQIGAEVIWHSDGSGPNFYGGDGSLVAIYRNGCYAKAQKDQQWERCAETPAGLEKMGPLKDGAVEFAPFAGV